jgi:hypothetical protein
MRLVILIALAGVVSMIAAAGAVAADKTTGGGAAVKKFPAPVVDEIMNGWNGLSWGSKLETFKAKFPKAEKNAAGRWTDGEADQKLVGIPGQVLYGFNSKNELYLVTFQPSEEEMPTFRKKLIAAGVLREGKSANWKNGPISFVVADVNDGQLAVIVNAEYVDPSTRPATAPEKK